MKMNLFHVTVAVTLSIISAAACTSSSDEHGHETAAGDASADAASNAATRESGSVEATFDDAATKPDASSCEPACESGKICCVDAHGHFPTCRPDLSCP